MSRSDVPRRRAHQLTAIVLLASLTLAACRDTQERVESRVNGRGAPQVAADTIDLDVLAYLDKHKLPGATLAVTKNGRLVYSKGYGWANRDTGLPMQPHHRSRIGSVSKLLVTIAILQLVENGTISLDDSVYGKADWERAGWSPEDLERWQPTMSDEAVLADPEGYWLAMAESARRLRSTYGTIGPMTFKAASGVTVKHLLSHTSGIVGNGNIKKAEEHFGRDRWRSLTYRQLHLAALKGLRDADESSREMKHVFGGTYYVPKTIEVSVKDYYTTSHPIGRLSTLPGFDALLEDWIDAKGLDPGAMVEVSNPRWTGRTYSLPPFGFAPGTNWSYSNHSFGLAGLIVEEQSGVPYQTYVEREILGPVGVWDPEIPPGGQQHFVPGWYRHRLAYDAFPHGLGLDPESPNLRDNPNVSGPLGLATGGWSASAQDLVRVMCGLDQGSNHLRLLSDKSTATMATVAYPQANGSQPLGWDTLNGSTELSKGGRIAGGRTYVKKFLPGHFSTDRNMEINIAIAFNEKTNATPNQLLRDIADVVASTQIQGDYDLFDARHACRVDDPTITIEEPVDFQQFELGEEISFTATATDGAGNPLSVTWQLPDNIEKPTDPGPLGNSGFYYHQMPAGRHTIIATATDTGGHQASAEVTITVTYEPPQIGILTPAVTATPWAHEELQLSAWSQVRGLHTLPDDRVAWRVTRDGGQPVYSSTGHTTAVPASRMEPGTYQIRVAGFDGVQQAEDNITITVEPRPTTLPHVAIHSPDNGSSYMTRGYNKPTDDVIEFVGAATEAHGGATIDGTRFRWSTVMQGETQPTVICEGSRFGTTGSGIGPEPASDCEHILMDMSELGPPGFGPEGTRYLIMLQVSDRHGNVGDDRRTISLVVHPPA